MKDFLTLRSFALGMPIGLVIGLQRIIQISETGLGTSAIASSDSENSPRREALIQMIATIISVMIAVLITSYIFTYGRYNVSGVELVGNGFVRISGYFESIKDVLGMGGIWLVLIFFVISGMTTVLGSFHFMNRSMAGTENVKIAIYLALISTSGILSINSFDVIFDIADLLMFVVSAINILAMLSYIKTYRGITKEEDLQCLKSI
jgi:Na+/alanine symporter